MAELIGRKCGMMRIFSEDGAAIPVTVLIVLPNRVVQVKEEASDGYRAAQITFGTKSPSKIDKASIGHFAKAKVEPGLGLWEIALDKATECTNNTIFTVETFKVGDKVDIQGISKGKGFQGVVKRYNFTMQDATHGNSLSHRAPGSIGQRQTPGRVFPGKKMAGHMGAETCSVLNQKVVKIDVARNLLFVEGAVPGAPNGHVVIKHSVKSKKDKR